ncbi:MAG: hypothetical protein ACFWT7_00280 [Succiniclasticum sp.]|jgi:rhamnosyltransferase
MKKLAGVVILYNPDMDVVDNIQSYYPMLDKLYVVDNSSQPNGAVVAAISSLDNVVYIPHGENLGISYSLNEVLRLVKDSHEWLLTMDQDSCFYDGKMEDYIKCLDYVSKSDSPVYGVTFATSGTINPLFPEGAVFEDEVCITSGNIINVRRALEAGGFDENLFIDRVDFDFCFQCQKKGYKLLNYNKVLMKHQLGDTRTGQFFGVHFWFPDHSYIRFYYVVRNSIYMMFKYSTIRKGILRGLLNDFICNCILGKHKIKKLQYAVKGFLDALRGNMGRMSS